MEVVANSVTCATSRMSPDTERTCFACYMLCSSGVLLCVLLLAHLVQRRRLSGSNCGVVHQEKKRGTLQDRKRDLKAESKLLRKAEEEDLTLAAGCAPVDASTAATLDGTSRDAKPRQGPP
ncbi:unnamed protein product, partial [Polarella glacialis]